MAAGLDNLKIYKMAEQLQIDVHELTRHFPPDEKCRSVDQLRRSSSSVTNNIAESHHRRSAREKIRILQDIVKGEAEETKRNLMACLKKGFHSEKGIIDKYTELLKAISGYLRFLRRTSAIGRNL